MPRHPDDNVTNKLIRRLVNKQTFFCLEDRNQPWQFGFKMSFGIQIFVSYHCPFYHDGQQDLKTSAPLIANDFFPPLEDIY